MTDKEKIAYLIEALNIIENSINNQAPDMALWEVNRAVQTVENWEESSD